MQFQKETTIKVKNRNGIFSAVFLISVFGFYTSARAEITLPSIFGSNMVLKQNSEVSIWGTSDSKRQVSLTTSWNKKTYQAKPDKDGNWSVKVSTPKAGGPYQIDITDGTTLRLENVLIGEVWVCSGQSNMEWRIGITGSLDSPKPNEVILRSHNPAIRLFEVKNETSLEPKGDFTGTWEVCGPGTVGNFSAVGYYYGQLLNEVLGVPIGLISSDWGGTRIQAWIDEQGLESFDPATLEDRKKEVRPNTSSALFNAMIHPMLGFGISGVIWYQGESNRLEPEVYDELMVLMVERWRKLWNVGDFPFYYCQIAPFNYNDDKVNSAFLREAQLKASKKIPNSGMVSLMDTGEEHDIHPNNKQVAGERLAYLALTQTYGLDGIAAKGPELKEMRIEGAEIVLTFDHATGGLTDYGKGLHQFTIAGADKKFYPAKVKLVRGNTITLYSDQVPEPVAARYAFDDFVVGDLYNRAGLPAPSFRTDDW